jgi:hypothetical protein
MTGKSTEQGRPMLRDRDIGKLMVEEMNLEPFVEAFSLFTGRSIEIPVAASHLILRR